MVDLLNIQPSAITRDLRNKYILIYSLPKIGKTSFAAEAGALIFGFEKGINAISGAWFQPINTWSDFKVSLKQLEKPEVKEKYETIAIDTIGIAWSYCEEFICAQNGVSKIGDIPWGAGYAACKKEFESALRKITMLDYGLILIAHSETRVEKIDDTNSIEMIGPQIPKRATEVCNALVDIIGYIGVEFDDEGNSRRTLYTRKTPTIMAGSRFPHLPPKIPFGYRELTDALVAAIELSESRDGATVLDRPLEIVEEKRPFSEVQEEAKQIWTDLIEKNTENAQKVFNIIERVTGVQKKLSYFTDEDQDLLELVLMEMKAL